MNNQENFTPNVSNIGNQNNQIQMNCGKTNVALSKFVKPFYFL